MYNSLTNMHSFLISSKDPQKSLEKAKEILKERGIGKWDLSEITPEKILGIEEVRKFSEKLFFKSRGTEKALVLNLYKGATIEAQNSMLKILEEPPKNTLIIILAENSNQFLPTITSRCKIIELENKEVPKGSGEVFEIFDQNIGERFYLAQTLYEDKEAAVVWLEDQINSLREKAKKEKSGQQTKKFAKTIREFIEARRLIKNTNVNARLTLEHLFLNLD
ncbi:MAG TPA: hypothetical protein DCZ82_04980 [Candidatus Levybacteria bacterium]|nr:hypothetical protein [Candidatus Levybacteria bacterium]